MNFKFDLTAHMVLYNEEKWLKFAILSVLPHVESLIIFDTGSTDKTVEIIKQIKSNKILFFEKGKVNRRELIVLRNEQIEMTKTKWFMIADGDEAYPNRIFDKFNAIDTERFLGVFLKNHMCVGDVFHELPARYGKYKLCGEAGHLNMRFYQKHDGWKWWGEYPLEFYGDEKGNSINQMCDKLFFLDDYYWHMSFLERSGDASRNHVKYHLGEKINDELPEGLRGDVLEKRSFEYIARSLIETPIRYLKNIILSNR
jgi:glycosyltransferase involved in cell wall biosynthesis